MKISIDQIISLLNTRYGFAVREEADGRALFKTQLDWPTSWDPNLKSRLYNLCASLKDAKENDAVFLISADFLAEFKTSRPGLLIIDEKLLGSLVAYEFLQNIPIVTAQSGYLALAAVAEYLAASLYRTGSGGLKPWPVIGASPNIHPSAVIHPSALIEEDVEIGPFVVVEQNVRIGKGTRVQAGCVLGPLAEIGQFCVLFPNVTLYERVRIGNRVRIHSGAVLGSDGFGYVQVPTDKGVCHRKIMHLGTVEIGDDVEIGANTTIDRGTLGATLVEKGAKLDNQVHMGHNSFCGEGAILCGGVRLAGNARVEPYALLGGMVGVTNHITVGAQAKVGAMSLVSKDVMKGEEVIGVPLRGYREHFRAHAALNGLLKKNKGTLQPTVVKDAPAPRARPFQDSEI